MEESYKFLVENWGEEIAKAIKEEAERNPLNITHKEFFNHCTACGGNWGGLLLSGIKELSPAIWKLIPDNMGKNGVTAFACLCDVLALLNVTED